MLSTPVQPSPRRTRIAIAIFFFVSGFGFSSWASRIPAFEEKLHLSKAEMGAVLFAFPAGMMCTLPLTNFLLRRISSRHTLLTGAVFFNLMLALVGFSEKTWQLAAVLFFFGCSRNLFNISANAQTIGVQKLYPRSIISSFHGIWSAAGFAAGGISSLAIAFNIIPAWQFVAISVVLTGLCLYFINDTLNQQPQPHERLKKSTFQLPDNALLKLGFICFASMACEGTMIDWCAIYMEDAVKAPQEMGATAYSIYMIAMMVMRFGGDRLANSIGVKRMLQGSGLFIVAGLLLAAIFPYTLTTIIGFVMTGFGVACVVPMVFSMAGRVKHMSGGPAIAGVSTIGYFGFLIVPPMVGFIAHELNLRWSLAFIALFGVLITWLTSQQKEA